MNTIWVNFVKRIRSFYSSIKSNKNYKFLVISISFFFFIFLFICSIHSSVSNDDKEIMPDHTEIAATIYAEIFLRTEIAATIYAQITPVESSTPIPTQDPFISIFAQYPCSDLSYFKIQGKVSAILSEDLIEVFVNNEPKIVRYLGLDNPDETTTKISDSAKVKSQELALGRDVTILTNNAYDEHGNLLGYIFTPNSFVNLELIRAGLFKATKNDSLPFAFLFSNYEFQAEESQLGIWLFPTETSTPISTKTPIPTKTSSPSLNCHPSYPDVCIPYPPPDLDCGDIPYRRFRVLPPDPHGFDGDNDGIGCESE